MKLAVPDLISNSYFPAVAAVDLGFFRDEGMDVDLELVFPVTRAYKALQAGEIDFVAGAAHSALSAFPNWQGVKLLCAQAQGMYWFLVMRSDLFPERNKLDIVRGRRIGAAPWVEMGLRRLLIDAGYDPARDKIQIGPVPGTLKESAPVNFGLMAADALAGGKIDGFWANGMGAEIAVRSGTGTIVLDVRRGDGPAACFNYTMASIAATEQLIAQTPEYAASAIRAINMAHAALTADPELAQDIARKRFPPGPTRLIADLIRRDLPFYRSTIKEEFVTGMNRFCADLGLLERDMLYSDVVAAQFSDLWS